MCKLIESGGGLAAGEIEDTQESKREPKKSTFGSHPKPADAEGFDEAAIEHALNVEAAALAGTSFYLKKKYKRRLPPSE